MKNYDLKKAPGKKLLDAFYYAHFYFKNWLPANSR